MYCKTLSEGGAGLKPLHYLPTFTVALSTVPRLFTSVPFKRPHDFKRSTLWMLFTVALVCTKPRPDRPYV